MTDIPEANDFSRSQATIVYWNDGKTELGRFSAENRESVGIEDIRDLIAIRRAVGRPATTDAEESVAPTDGPAAA